jgi:DNA-binding NarL/FixJ family response regulator
MVPDEMLEQALDDCLTALAKLARIAGAPRHGRLVEIAELLSMPRIDTVGKPPAAVALIAPVVQFAAANPLTARECEVASEIARGLTNRQIADELGIGKRTADSHVQNILGKLGLATRSQVAAWVTQQTYASPALPGGG